MKLTLLILSIFIISCFFLFVICTIITGYINDKKYKVKHNWTEDILMFLLMLLIFGSFFYIGYYIAS